MKSALAFILLALNHFIIFFAVSTIFSNSFEVCVSHCFMYIRLSRKKIDSTGIYMKAPNMVPYQGPSNKSNRWLKMFLTRALWLQFIRIKNNWSWFFVISTGMQFSKYQAMWKTIETLKIGKNEWRVKHCVVLRPFVNPHLETVVEKILGVSMFFL